ncbi:MAG: aminopeptidase [Thermaerobacter sp.]|nr:aminopeptidase [Thermaerobacter sp.]
MRSFAENLDLYARVAAQVGVNVHKGQRVYISAQLQGAEFVRRLVRESYAAGAYDVFVDWHDDRVSLIRYLHAPAEALADVPQWLVAMRETLVDQRAAYIAVHAPTPNLFKDVDPQRLASATRALSKALKKSNEDRVTRTNWLIVSPASPQWAAQVYPDASPDQALEQLWEDVFRLCRIDQEDPIAAWREHSADLAQRADFLTRCAIKTLHYEGPGTDLVLELPKGHVWRGGGGTSESGAQYVPNMPTEEVFTLPKRDGVNGTVRATMPLNYNGVTVENIRLELRNGEIVKYAADSGYETLRTIIETDEGSRRLGEAALVSQDSPIARSGRLYYNTLYDENASCHLAIGRAYATSLAGGQDMSEDELLAAGANQSMTHVDFMIGSDELDVTAEAWDGKKVPILHKGRWAFQV